MTVVDLFAGPGGWDGAARALGLDPLGIECDDAACATRAEVGLRTLQADVAALNPLDFAPCMGMIGSPPCPTFSMAGGGGGGRLLTDVILGCARELLAGRDARAAAIEEARALLEPVCWEQEQEAAAKKGRRADRAKSEARAEREAAMSLLVVEPLRWALALRPDWIALEQVPPVLALWEAFAALLREAGYNTWTGVLSAEQFGVPQTRQRAFLLASLDGPVSRPAPTHQRYVAPRAVEEETLGLFEPVAERVVHREDRDLLPWVSMAEALGWGMTARPYPVLAGGTGGGPDLEKVGGSSARAVIYEEQAAGRWAGVFRGFGRATASGARPDGVWFRANAQARSAVRTADEPAPTITGGHDHNERVWLRTGNFSAVARDADGGRSAAGSVPYERAASEPAPTIAGESRNDSWCASRAATTVAGDPRVHPPGHKVNGDDLAAGRDDYEGRAGENAVRVSIEEAAVLQSFPPDYPWQGTKTKQFEQVGNAVPPLLAWHVLGAVVPVALEDVA